MYKKSMRVYDLLEVPQGKRHGTNDEPITQVAAYSPRQALFLAARGDWSDGVKPGIVAVGSDSSQARQWRFYDRLSRPEGSPWKHSQLFDPLLPRVPTDEELFRLIDELQYPARRSDCSSGKRFRLAKPLPPPDPTW